MEKISKNVWDNKEFVLFLSLIYFYCVFRSKTIIWITIPLYLIIIARYIDKNRDYGGAIHMGETIQSITGILTQEKYYPEKVKSIYKEELKVHPLKIGVVIHASFIKEAIDSLEDLEKSSE